PGVRDAQLATGLRLVELPAADDLHHADGQLAVAETVRGGADHPPPGPDVEARDHLALQRLPLGEAPLVAVLDVARVVPDVFADRATLLPGRSGRRRFRRCLLLDDHRPGLGLHGAVAAALRLRALGRLGLGR